MRKLLIPTLILLTLTACPSKDDQKAIFAYLRQGAFVLAANVLDKQLSKLDSEIVAIGDANVEARFKEYVQEFREIKHQLGNLKGKEGLGELAQSIMSLYQSARSDIASLPEGKVKDALQKLFNGLDKYLFPFMDYLPQKAVVGGPVAADYSGR